MAGLAQLPHLTAEEMTVLLHGLVLLDPQAPWARNLPELETPRAREIAGSLATALREGIIAAERAPG